MQSFRTIKDDHEEIIRKIGVSRNLYTKKYETFFGNLDRDKKPIINLPLPDSSDKTYLIHIREMKKVAIGLLSVAICLPFILVKYPILDSRILKQYLRVFSEYVTPIIDDRWDRSMIEWGQIIAYSKLHGYHATSRKFPAIKDGKEKYLSPNYIKHRAKVIDKYNSFLMKPKNVKIFTECSSKIIEILKSDKELQRILKRLFLKYYPQTA